MRSTRARSARGQTALDFLVGMSVFLLALGFVLAFVPSMFAPFFGMGVGDAMAADRGAAYLTENALVEDPATPGVLDEEKVDDFFNASECDNDPGAYLEDELGLRGNNVAASIGDKWECGDDPSGAETVSRRIVSVNGTQHTLRVVVW